MTGMTLVHHEWHPKPGAERCFNGWSWYYPESECDQTTTAHVIPDGTWIMERPSFGWLWLIGVEHSELTDLSITSENGVSRTLYLCDRPFGYVVVDSDDIDVIARMPRPGTRKRLYSARQVHKGELSHGVPLQEKIGYVRANDKKQGNGWVRLSGLVRATDIAAEDLIFSYWQFSQHLNHQWHENDQQDSQLVDVVIAWTTNEILHKDPEVEFFTREQMRRHLSCSTDQNIWIRRGFAYTILRLLALGYKPAKQSA